MIFQLCRFGMLGRKDSCKKEVNIFVRVIRSCPPLLIYMGLRKQRSNER